MTERMFSGTVRVGGDRRNTTPIMHESVDCCRVHAMPRRAQNSVYLKLFLRAVCAEAAEPLSLGPLHVPSIQSSVEQNSRCYVRAWVWFASRNSPDKWH